ncbi:hypothetical protein AVEN_12541-1 [Araneus ventricosus]|uniref:Uncharacterized protein n=1 Tax=Araneus ventricosus TaxID=182803 RepID=A0A4Y2TMA4_ARAVE|nr:hypothetical protein AVEN_12541-1 [Araneus ventricosus]
MGVRFKIYGPSEFSTIGSRSVTERGVPLRTRTSYSSHSSEDFGAEFYVLLSPVFFYVSSLYLFFLFDWIEGKDDADFARGGRRKEVTVEICGVVSG